MAATTGGTTGATTRDSGLERARSEYEATGETKSGLRTTEFLSSLIAALGVLIAAAVADDFSAEEAWRLVSFLSIGYMISRGLAKMGVGRRG